MRKYKNLFTSYLIALSLGIIIYYFIYNLYLSLIFLISTFILFNFYILPKLNKIKIFRKSLNTFSHLANSLVMQITVTPNVTSALNEISYFLDDQQKVILQNDELLVKEKLESIEEYYKFPLYQVFKEIIILYDTQGGDIINMSMQLLGQIDNYIKNVETIILDNSKKYSEVLILWGFGIGALFYIKKILYDYYIEIIKITNFQLIVALFFFLFLMTLFSLSRKYIEVKIGE